VSLIAELRRRNVFRVALAYLAGAWLLIQVADTAFPAYGLPDSALPLLITVLVIGVVPVAALSWAYEWTSAGITREADGERAGTIPRRGHRSLDRIIMVVLALGLTYFAVDKFVISKSRVESIAESAREQGRVEALTGSVSGLSIAVLPFANLSSDPAQAFFADGISEELLNLLARIPQLRVTSRSSAFEFRGQSVNIREVAEKLNVAHVLEGSVRRAGDTVRITVNLVDARSDTNLWNQSYERQLTNIFAIQEDIAQHVVQSVQPALLGAVPAPEPVDAQAYALNLQAQQIYRQQLFDQFDRAEALLLEALQIEPDYVEAMVNLMILHTFGPPREGEKPEDRERQIELLRNRAVAVDPDDPNLLNLLAWMTDDMEERIQFYYRVLQQHPADTDSISGLANVALGLGRFELAIAAYNHGLQRDPLDVWAHWNIAQAYAGAGRVDEALAEFAIGNNLSSDAWGGYWKAGLVRLVNDDPAGALIEFEQEPNENYQLHGMTLALHDLGRAEESSAALGALWAIEGDGSMWPHGFARLYAWLGRNDEAFRFLELTAATQPAGLEGAAFNPLYRKLHDDPRWLPFLRRNGLAPEQLAQIELEIPIPETVAGRL